MDTIESVASSFFEQLIASQYHLRFSGVWIDNTGIVVGVISDAKPLARDGEDFAHWLEGNRPLGYRVRLHLGEPPEGAYLIRSRTDSERATGFGKLRTLEGLWHDLASTLPAGFPDFIVWQSIRGVFLEPASLLSASQEQSLSEAVRRLGIHVAPKLCRPGEYNEARISNEGAKWLRCADGTDTGPMQLTSPRALKQRGAGERTVIIAQRDQDFWSMVRSGLWKGSDATETVRPLPDKGRASARIHVPASVFPAIDLRVLLPVYETIVLSPPIAENQDEVLSSLGVAVSDIAELIRRGRVEIALPLSLDRYSPTLLDALSEVSTDVIVGPRELSYWGVVETRKRVPLLFPAIDPLGRAQVLRELRSIAKTSGLTASQAAYVNILAECWSRQEELVDERGPLGLTVCGIGRLVGDLYQQVTGRELLLEFGSAGTSVEVAAVTGAAVCPVSTDGYSEYGHTRIICGVFDGFREQLTQMNFQRVAFALDGLLGVSREVPIVELADALSGPDVSRLRAVLVDIANENVDQTSVEETVRKFNLAIERYAGRKRLAEKVLDMRGLISATVGLIAAKAEEVAAVPAILEGATFLRDRLRALSEEYPSIRPLADAVESSLLGARPRTTLVSRMRSSIAGIRRDAHDKE